MDVINQIARQYELATQHWFHYLFPIANRLFAILATIEIAWAGIWWAIEKNEVTSIVAEMLQKIIVLGLCYALLLHANEWIPAILKSFMQIGAGASHVSHLYPNDILNQGVALAGQLLGLLTLKGMLLNIFAQVICLVVAFVVVIGYALIAAQVLVVQIESYIVVGAGVILLGFSGHSLTRQISLNYFNYAITVGVQLFILFMIVSVGSNVTQEWSKAILLSGLSDPRDIFAIAGGVLVFVFVVWVVPAKAQGLLSGSLVIPNRSVTNITNQVRQWVKNKKENTLTNTSTSSGLSPSRNRQTPHTVGISVTPRGQANGFNHRPVNPNLNRVTTMSGNNPSRLRKMPHSSPRQNRARTSHENES